MQLLLLELFAQPFSSSTSTPILVLLFAFVFVLSIPVLVHVSSTCRKGRRLPPGSLGWPYIGETLKLYTEDPNKFYAGRQKRYAAW